MYNIAVQIYIGKTIFTYTAKVDLVLIYIGTMILRKCAQQQRVNDQNLKSASEKWHLKYAEKRVFLFICMKDKQI